MILPNSNATSTTFELSLAPGSNTFTLLTAKPRFILSWYSSSGSGISRTDLRCGGQNITHQVVVFELNITDLFYYCDKAITASYQTTASPTIYGTLTTMEINSSIATDTPYTYANWYSNGAEYHYNPLLSQIGIFLWVIMFFAVVGLFWKMYKNI